MSAIGGIYRLHQRPVVREDLSRLMDEMKPLGREGQSLWLDGPVALIHSLTRFSHEELLDQQPLHADRLALTADLRLDNREELCRDLGIDPPRSRSMADSRLLFESYRKWGEDCPLHLLGDFAFAIWDDEKQKLFCARDHLGGFPFYYHHGLRFFAFATVARHLLSLPGVSSQLNESQIADLLVLLPNSLESTYYQAVRNLPAGHSITINAHGAKLRCFWSLEGIPEIRFKRDDDYVEAFQELLEAAVSCRIRTPYRLGSFLSGGLDSSSIAVMAARKLQAENKRLLTYTSVPREGAGISKRLGRFGDERPFVEDIVDCAGNLDPQYLTMPGRSPLENLEPAFRIAGPPQNIFNYLLDQTIGEKAQQQGVRVMLDGSAGNFAMSRIGEGRLIALAVEGQWATLLRELGSLSKASGRSRWWFIRSWILKPLFAPALAWVHFRWVRWGGRPRWTRYSAIHPDFARGQDVASRFRRLESQNRFLAGSRAPGEALKSLSQVLDTSNRDLGSVWKALYGISVRDPTRDRRLVTFALGVPDDQYLHDGQDRSLIRRAMSAMLPASVISNRRVGYQAADWMECFETYRADFVHELEQLRRSDSTGRILDLDRMENVLGAWNRVDPYSSKAERLFRRMFSRGLIVGRFVRWHESN